MASTASAFNNTFKLFTEASNIALNTITKNDAKYFNLLNEKEKSSYHLLERDTELFKKKNELNSFILMKKDSQNHIKHLKKNQQYSNKKIENTLFFNQNQPIINMKLQKPEDNIKINLINGITMTVSKYNLNNSLSFGLNKIHFTNKSNPTQAECLDVLYNEDPETALLYLAYNL